MKTNYDFKQEPINISIYSFNGLVSGSEYKKISTAEGTKMIPTNTPVGAVSISNNVVSYEIRVAEDGTFQNDAHSPFKKGLENNTAYGTSNFKQVEIDFPGALPLLKKLANLYLRHE